MTSSKGIATSHRQAVALPAMAGHRMRMSRAEHEAVVRRSFERQAALFSGPDSPFARRSGSMAWVTEPSQSLQKAGSEDCRGPSSSIQQRRKNIESGFLPSVESQRVVYEQVS
jgi:hypothetical protein